MPVRNITNFVGRHGVAIALAILAYSWTLIATALLGVPFVPEWLRVIVYFLILPLVFLEAAPSLNEDATTDNTSHQRPKYPMIRRVIGVLVLITYCVCGWDWWLGANLIDAFAWVPLLGSVSALNQADRIRRQDAFPIGA